MLQYIVRLRWPENIKDYRRYQQHSSLLKHPPPLATCCADIYVTAPDAESAELFARTDIARQNDISISDVQSVDRPEARPRPAYANDGQAYVNLYVDKNNRIHTGGIYADPESCEHARGSNTSRRFLGSFAVKWPPE